MFELNGSQCMVSGRPKKTYGMRQVLLVRHNTKKTVWIPTKYAVKGKYIRIKDENGWMVDKVFKKELNNSYLRELSESYKNTRKTSDV